MEYSSPSCLLGLLGDNSERHSTSLSNTSSCQHVMKKNNSKWVNLLKWTSCEAQVWDKRVSILAENLFIQLLMVLGLIWVQYTLCMSSDKGETFTIVYKTLSVFSLPRSLFHWDTTKSWFSRSQTWRNVAHNHFWYQKLSSRSQLQMTKMSQTILRRMSYLQRC